jgi:hypothetical protein
MDFDTMDELNPELRSYLKLNEMHLKKYSDDICQKLLELGASEEEIFDYRDIFFILQDYMDGISIDDLVEEEWLSIQTDR